MGLVPDGGVEVVAGSGGGGDGGDAGVVGSDATWVPLDASGGVGSTP